MITKWKSILSFNFIAIFCIVIFWIITFSACNKNYPSKDYSYVVTSKQEIIGFNFDVGEMYNYNQIYFSNGNLIIKHPYDTKLNSIKSNVEELIISPPYIIKLLEND